MSSISPESPAEPTQLIVFADDWGRHPSSAQHLVRELLPGHPTLWVNTVGTRTPGLNRADLGRACGVLKRWLGGAGAGAGRAGPALPDGLRVVAPRMYPGFRRGWQRRFNARQVSGAVRRGLGMTGPKHVGGHPRALDRVVVTTLPITADLVGKLGADRWVYYCVDDYSQWPGTDHAVMDAMERELVAKVDAVVCVSETLRGRVASMGRGDSTLLTHGVDVEMWQTPAVDSRVSKRWPGDDKPVALFWGLIDERLDLVWLDALLAGCPSYLVLAGPRQIEFANSPGSLGDVSFSVIEQVYLGPIAQRDLAAHAALAQVLVMPYVDAPVTRAMQPLKLKEYLATMKPVVVRDLPATREWADCCDLASSAEQFALLVRERAQTGAPASQLEARRRRLPGESWAGKAQELAAVIHGAGGSPPA
ncbi:hypothetical protein OT109_02500 [Phycisphaeraceae bacterium D3-23]